MYIYYLNGIWAPISHMELIKLFVEISITFHCRYLCYVEVI